MRENQQMQQLFIQFINYVSALPHVSALHYHLQLSISQKAQGTLPEDCNVMPKHVEATIHN
jgi:hypothetical protein